MTKDKADVLAEGELPELLPCPFCGSVAKFETDNSEEALASGGGWIFVDCSICPIQTYPQSNKRDALIIWNTRASAAPVDVPREVPATVLREAVEAMRLAGLALTEMNFPGSPFGIKDELYAAWKRAEAALVTAPSSSVSETEIRNQALEEALIYIQRFCRGRLHVGSDPSKVAAKVCYDKASTALASNHSEPDIEAQGR